MKMKAIVEWIHHKATGKNTLGMIGVSILLLIPYLVSFSSLTSEGLLIDQTFNFNMSDVHRILGSYGSSGRIEYLRAEAIDVIVIPVIVLTLSLIIGYCLKQRVWSKNFLFVALCAGILNTIKVFLIIPLILIYPIELPSLVGIANGVNMLKIMAMVSTGFLLIATLGFIFAKNLKKLLDR
jgi:hypothetical protein